MEEFSHPIKAGQIKDQPREYHLKANETQRAALTERFGLEAIALLEGHFQLKHERSGIIIATLKMQAEVTQVCVVTLEPFLEQLKEETILRFVPQAMVQRRESEDNDEESEEDITPESLDSPDEIPYENDLIDLGAALSEQLALTLPPYPRKPGAALPDSATDNSANPFALLANKLGKKP